MQEREDITIFTDGSCFYKVQKGGSSVYIQWKDKEYFIRKGWYRTTVGRCELRAFLLAIQSLSYKIPITATIYSDSQYVTEGLNKHIRNWIDHNWKGCENVDLWKAILKELEDHTKLRVRVKWTPSHRKNVENPIVFGNAVADILADYKNFDKYEIDNKN